MKKTVSKNLKGPSWSPKKIKNINIQEKEKQTASKEASVEINSSVKQSTKDSVRAIMLIRAYRIRGHLIANLDPLNLQKGFNILNLNLRPMDLQWMIIIEKYFSTGFWVWNMAH